MMRSRGYWLAFVFVALLQAVTGYAGQQDSVRHVALLVPDNYSQPVAKAMAQLRADSDFAKNYRIYAAGDTALDLSTVDVAVCYVHTPGVLQRYTGQLQQAIARGARVYAVGQTPDASTYIKQGIRFDGDVTAYFEHPSPTNLANLMRMLVRRHLDATFDVDPPVSYPEQGIVDLSNGSIHGNLRSYLAATRSADAPVRPWVGLYFFRYEAVTEQLDYVRAYADGLDMAGFDVLPFFGHPLDQALNAYCLAPDSSVRLSALITFSSLPGASPDVLRATFEKLQVPVINAIGLQDSEASWQASTTGIPVGARALSLAQPELTGQVQPFVAYTQEAVTDGDVTYRIKHTPPSRVARLAGRLQAWHRLQTLPNPEKEIALIYYNGHPGKHNIGASYLNVLPESMFSILERLADERYEVGRQVPSADTLFSQVMRGGRNIGTWAPAELEQLVAAGEPVLISLNTYKKWFATLHPRFRQSVTAKWGEPDTARIMTWQANDGQRYFVLPRVRYGHIHLMPQPARGWDEDAEALFHDVSLPPHHQYIAFYLYLQHGLAADAIIHLGTHGTHEWLSGREVGFDDDDAPEALIGNLVNIYPYIMDNVGEGTQAKRRGMATIIDHLTPPFDQASLNPRLRDLAGAINDYSVALEKSPSLAAVHLQTINRLADAAHVYGDLGLDDTIRAEDVQRVEHYLQEINESIVPLGMHTFGRSPDSTAAMQTAAAIVSRMSCIDPDTCEAQLQDLYRRIRASGPAELDALVAALDGRYITPGPGNDPIRSPAALPTGRNFYSFDPSRLPTEDTYRAGYRLAEELLANYREKHGGRYPEKVALTLWSVETIRHEGIMESQILALLGVKPRYDGAGRILGLEVIPADSLGRPRIDVVVTPSGLYRDMFPMLVGLIDEGVDLAYQQVESNNFIRTHVDSARQQLLAAGIVDTALARRLASIRLFGTASGTYGTGVNEAVQASDQWDDEEQIANVYYHRMGHLYGQGFWGDDPAGALPENARDLAVDIFRRALSGTEAVIHSRSTNVYGALDNDDFFQYLGGMAMAVRGVDGSTPDVMITNLTDPGAMHQETLDQFIGREMQARYLNPKWIEEMLDEGYAGARMVGQVVDNLWGWQVTTPEAIDAQRWEDWFDTYVADQYDLDIRARFAEAGNTYAYQTMLARMLEVTRKGYWTPDAETLDKLVTEYLETTEAAGLSCAGNVCGNTKLTEYLTDVTDGTAQADAMHHLIDRLGKLRPTSPVEAPGGQAAASSGNASIPKPATPSAAPATQDAPVERPQPLKGYRMETTTHELGAVQRGSQSSTPIPGIELIGLLLFVIIGFYIGRWRP